MRVQYLYLLFILGIAITSCLDDDVLDITFEDQFFTVEENSEPETLVGSILIPESETLSLSYRIEGGNQDVFFLVNNEGEIRLSELADIDYEKTQAYNLTISARGEKSESDASISIEVIDVVEPELRPLTDDEIYTLNYFKEVALGFEFGGADKITRKWRDTMLYNVGGYPTSWMLEELEEIIEEIQELVTNNFVIVQSADPQRSNMMVFFGNGEEYSNIYSPAKEYIGSNWGLFFLSWDHHNYIDQGTMYVDIERAHDTAIKHLLREEFTQSLGLARDSNQYPNSIFQSSWTTVEEYHPIDREVIRLLYHPSMVPGLNASEAETVIASIFRQE